MGLERSCIQQWTRTIRLCLTTVWTAKSSVESSVVLRFASFRGRPRGRCKAVLVGFLPTSFGAVSFSAQTSRPSTKALRPSLRITSLWVLVDSPTFDAEPAFKVGKTIAGLWTNPRNQVRLGLPRGLPDAPVA